MIIKEVLPDLKETAEEVAPEDLNQTRLYLGERRNPSRLWLNGPIVNGTSAGCTSQLEDKPLEYPMGNEPVGALQQPSKAPVHGAHAVMHRSHWPQ
jgi:hypothetical protein